MDDNYDFRILIIDDNVEIHKDFIRILTVHPTNELENLAEKLFDKQESKTKNIVLPNFKIDTATQGQEGVKLIAKALEESQPYALAFVDMRMPPGWDGIETIKNIWKIDKDIHIVICTAFSDYSWEETVEELGQSDNFLILKKPFDHVAVRQLAYALTRKWKLVQDSQAYTKSLEQAVEERTEELKYQATHDILTRLPNRVLLQDRINQAIAAYRRHQIPFALIFFDLDRFKLINDSLGHAAGDELLISIAKRLLPSMRAFDTLARLGGDEFVIVLTELKNEEDANLAAIKILNILKEPFYINEHTIFVTSSIGVCIYPQDAQQGDELLRNADAAMYYAKKSGSTQIQFYSKEMNEKIFAELELESQLYRAIENKELRLDFQPQFNIQEQRLIAVEALVRWDHPQKGLLYPMHFIPLAERTGLIVQIGEWVLKEVCKQSKLWKEAGIPPIRITVNIHSQQLSQPDFITRVKEIISESEIDPRYLELELSESCINNPTIVDAIKELKAIGIELSLKDFGSGYSILTHIRNLSLNRLKIDRAFIKNIPGDQNDKIIIQAIIAMARSLKLELLAEGVETQHQLDFLRKEEFNEIQGFYFSKPLSESALMELLKNPEAVDELLRKN